MGWLVRRALRGPPGSLRGLRPHFQLSVQTSFNTNNSPSAHCPALHLHSSHAIIHLYCYPFHQQGKAAQRGYGPCPRGGRWQRWSSDNNHGLPSGAFTHLLQVSYRRRWPMGWPIEVLRPEHSELCISVALQQRAAFYLLNLY